MPLHHAAAQWKCWGTRHTGWLADTAEAPQMPDIFAGDGRAVEVLDLAAPSMGSSTRSSMCLPQSAEKQMDARISARVITPQGLWRLREGKIPVGL
jgi:hypothetical protein